MQEMENLLKDIIEKGLEYFEGNEDNDLLVDPYLFQAAFFMQNNKIADS